MKGFHHDNSPSKIHCKLLTICFAATPMGYLPVLNVGDEQILTTVSMLYFLGSEMGM